MAAAPDAVSTLADKTAGRGGAMLMCLIRLVLQMYNPWQQR